LAISQNQTLLSSSSSSPPPPPPRYWLFCTAVEITDVMHSYCQITCGKMIVSDELAEVWEESGCFKKLFQNLLEGID
jgi:hypothetical protein